MNSLKLLVHPYIRLAFLILVPLGVILENNIYKLLALYLCVFVLLFLIGKELTKHLKLILFGIIPILLSYILIYILIYNDTSKSWEYIALRVIKITLITSTFQLCLMIPSQIQMFTFRKWGLSGDTLLVVLSAFTVPKDILNKSQKILESRFSRGFVRKRTTFNKLIQLPYILIPLLIGVLRTANERAESWEQKDITNLLQNVNYNQQNLKFSLPLNSILGIVIISWIIISIINSYTF